MSLRKGAWSPEEDQKLIAYISRYRIWNWSQMARPAGLERSGKSCRLRWVNYLKPGIKRGRFSKEDEDTVLKWHEVLGNRSYVMPEFDGPELEKSEAAAKLRFCSEKIRPADSVRARSYKYPSFTARWSAIAAKLSGRTDNEIKNYWHAHLKKRYTNNSHSTTVLHSVEPPGVEANMNESPGIQDLSPPDAPKMSNLPDSWSWGVEMSPQLSDLDDFSSSINDDPVEIDRNQTILAETFSPSETLDLQSLWEQPFSLDDMCMVETDDGVIYVSSY